LRISGGYAKKVVTWSHLDRHDLLIDGKRASHFCAKASSATPAASAVGDV
jgi:hypothetical protein